MPLRSPAPHLQLSRQFALASLVILISGMLVIGWSVSEQIQNAVFRQATKVTSAYVESFVSPYIYSYLENGYISPAMSLRFSQELSAADFGHPILLLKVWDREGHILYSNIPVLVGRSYPLNEHLQRAFAGDITAYTTELDQEEHYFERQFWDRLIKIYTPVYAPGTRDIIAVAEYYLPADALDDEIRQARIQSWRIVVAATLIMYITLFSLVKRADMIILRQSEQLERQVQKLEAFLRQNRALHARVQRAARRTIELNERFLRRISAELHDGPLQMLGAAALQLSSLPDQPSEEALQHVQTCIQESMQEMRALAAGLRLPDMDAISLFEVIERAVTRFEQRSRLSIRLDVGDLPVEANLSTELKIAIYRITEEALNNAWQHAQTDAISVSLWEEESHIHLKISDRGTGFDPAAQTNTDEVHLGLLSMRERAESLGGHFRLITAPGEGTTILVHLPILSEHGGDHE